MKESGQGPKVVVLLSRLLWRALLCACLFVAPGRLSLGKPVRERPDRPPACASPRCPEGAQEDRFKMFFPPPPPSRGAEAGTPNPGSGYRTCFRHFSATTSTCTSAGRTPEQDSSTCTTPGRQPSRSTRSLGPRCSETPGEKVGAFGSGSVAPCVVHAHDSGCRSGCRIVSLGATASSRPTRGVSIVVRRSPS